MSLAAATLAHRRALIAYEDTATRSIVAAYDRRVSPLLDRLRAVDEKLAAGQPLTSRERAQVKRDQDSLLRLIRQARRDVRSMAQQRLTGAAQAELKVSVRNLSAALPEGRTARAPGVDLRTLLTNPTAGSPWTARLDAQLVRTYERVDAALAIAINRGASIPDAARLVGEAVGAVEGQRHQLTRLVRTEIQRVANEAAQATYRENRDVVKAVRYLATLDSRVCAVCRPLHRKVFPLDALGNYNGPPVPRHPHCFPAGVVVTGPKAEAATKRWYEGPLVELETADGRHIPVTPNHPILTTKGWVAAGELDEGDELIHCADLQRLLSGGPDDELVPARIEEVAGALREAGPVSSAVVPLSPEDFHGDGLGGKVNVVGAERLLVDGLDASLLKQLLEVELSLRDVQPLRFSDASSEALGLPRVSGAPACFVCGGDVARVHLGGSVSHHQAVGFSLSSHLDASELEAPIQGGARHAVGLRQSVDGFPSIVASTNLIHRKRGLQAGSRSNFLDELFGRGLGSPEASTLEFLAKSLGANTELSSDGVTTLASSVGLDRVLKTRRRSFSGHVYNLQTTHGWYVANGIITHNCRCFLSPVTRSLAEILAAA